MGVEVLGRPDVDVRGLGGGGIAVLYIPKTNFKRLIDNKYKDNSEYKNKNDKQYFISRLFRKYFAAAKMINLQKRCSFQA